MEATDEEQPTAEIDAPYEDPIGPGIGPTTRIEAGETLYEAKRRLEERQLSNAPHRRRDLDDWEVPQGPLNRTSVQLQDTESVLRHASFRAWRWRWHQNPKVLRLPTVESEAIHMWVTSMLSAGFLEQVTSRGVFVACRHFAVRKPHDPDSFRIVGDFRPLNKLIKKEECVYPRIEQVWCEAAKVPFISCVDVQDGFYQVRVPYRYRKYFGLRVGNSWYRYTRLPQGFINAPAIFTAFMRSLLPQDERIMFYMDDVIGFGLHTQELEALLNEAGLPVKRSKSSTSLSEDGATLLGVRVSHRGENVIFEPTSRMQEAVRRWTDLIQTRSLAKRDLYAYAGVLQFMRAFIPGLTAHLYTLYQNTKNVMWDDECSWTPCAPLRFPFRAEMRWDEPWLLYVDASAEGYGCMFCKEGGTPLGLSKLRMDNAWRNLVGVYREIWAAEWAIHKWPCAAQMILHSDSAPVVQALAKQDFSRWSKVYAKKLQGLPQNWIHIPGEDNPADVWSRPLYVANVCVDDFSKHACLCGRRNKYKHT